jgi:hypothetical protein
MAQSVTDRERVAVEAVKQEFQFHCTALEQMSKFARTCTTLFEDARAPEPRPQEPNSLTTLRHALNFFVAQRKRREAADKVDEATRKQAEDRDEQMQQRVQRLQEMYMEMQVKEEPDQRINSQTEVTKM